jgi:hypothetical protein
MLLWYWDHVPKSIQKEFICYKKGDYVYHRIETDQLISGKLHYLREKHNWGKIIIRNTKFFLNYCHSAHNHEIYNLRQTIAGSKYNRLPAHTKLIKDNLLFRRQLKQLLIKVCCYSVGEYMCDDFTWNINYLVYMYSYIACIYFYLPTWICYWSSINCILIDWINEWHNIM